MVASVSRVVGNALGPTNERCIKVREAFKLGNNQWASIWPVGVLRAERDGKVTTEEIDQTNVRVGDYYAPVHTTGCLPEHEHMSTETIPAVINCPKDPAERCAGCIMNLAVGQELIDSMKPSTLSTGILRN